MLYSLRDSSAPLLYMEFDSIEEDENIMVLVPRNEELEVINYILKEMRYCFFVYYLNWFTN